MGEVLARATFIAVILYVFFRLWAAVYSGAGTQRLAGLTLSEMLWYLMMTEAIWMSSVRVCMEVDEDVRTGRLAVQLMKPLSYPGALLAKVLGERVVRFGLNVAVGALAALVFAGPIRVTVSGLAMFAAVLPLAFALDALGYLMVGLLAFWFDSTAGAALIYSRVFMLAGGMMLPLELYPERLRSALHWLPFASMVYGPARMLVAPDRAMFGRILLTQGVALVGFVLAVAVMERAAIQRIQSNGG
jgi:ABC-2 type transport system permease protein